MTTIQHEIQAACTPERLRAPFADLEAVERYNPGVRRAAIERKLRATVGEVFAALVRRAEGAAGSPGAERKA